MYIAHLRKDGNVQILKEHLINVQQLCESFGSKSSLKYTAGLAGILHDLGKYSTEFQAYLNAIKTFGMTKKKNGGDHATAGGQLLAKYAKTNEQKRALVPIINAIVAHHGKLLDIVSPIKEDSDFVKRLRKENNELQQIENHFFEEVMPENEFQKYIEYAIQEVNDYFANYIQHFKKVGFKASSTMAVYNHISVFLTKYIFSCLLDADRLDSKYFDEGKITASIKVDWALLQERLNEKIASFKVNNEIDYLRQEMSNQCFNKGKKETGIYSLSIPTGGGKTFASLRFALEHAIRQNKKKIIYIVPYTTIIEQNVKAVKDILWKETEENFILEHHSNVMNDEVSQWKNEKRRVDYSNQAKNFTDNWDSPIIFTTLVQYLNVFFDAKNRNTRRLHQLFDSVIIFDEIQSLPLQTTKLFNESIDYLAQFGRTTILLCTATQPALQSITKHIQKPVELVENLDHVIEQFNRTNINFLNKNGGYNTVELAELVYEKVYEENQVLIIVNTKLAARKLQQALVAKQTNEKILIYHLSTSMCPEHRRTILNEVKTNLNEQKKKIICISTQLIEAGVDISFNCVIRSLAGLSSIAQAAGRCNRHGLTSIKDVYVIKYNEENLSRLKEIADGGRIAEGILKDCQMHNKSPLSTKMITLYFESLFNSHKNKLDFVYKNTTLYHLFFKGFNEKNDNFYTNSIGTASKEFHVIDSESETVVVPYASGKEIGMSGRDIINLLLDDEEIQDFSLLMKNAQKYSINIFPHEKAQLEELGAITVVTFGERSIQILNNNSYSDEFGLTIESSNSTGIIM